MASLRSSAGEVVEAASRTSGSDAKTENGTDEKKGAIVFEATDDQLPSYVDVEGQEGSIHHPADEDDILTKTLHVEDDPTLNALTFRTWFLGMSSKPFKTLVSYF